MNKEAMIFEQHKSSFLGRECKTLENFRGIVFQSAFLSMRLAQGDRMVRELFVFFFIQTLFKQIIYRHGLAAVKLSIVKLSIVKVFVLLTQRAVQDRIRRSRVVVSLTHLIGEKIKI